MVILVGIVVAGLGAVLRLAEAGTAAGVNTHEVGLALLVVGCAELVLALLLRLPLRPPALVRPITLDQPDRSDDEHIDDKAA